MPSADCATFGALCEAVMKRHNLVASDKDRPELLAAAVAMFAERGFEVTRLEDVAARAGVSKATVYVYFADKERLFEAVVRETVVPNLDRARALIDGYAGTTPA